MIPTHRSASRRPAVSPLSVTAWVSMASISGKVKAGTSSSSLSLDSSLSAIRIRGKGGINSSCAA